MTPTRVAFALSLASLPAVDLCAQCPLQQQVAVAPPGLDGAVNAVVEWDPDGPGPMVSRIVCGGEFESAGGKVAAYIAEFDPVLSEWRAMPGLNNKVRSLVVRGTDLIAGGDMTGGVVRWNGNAWQVVGSGVYGRVDAMLVEPTGDLVVGGPVTGSGVVAANGVMRWDGLNWSAVGFAPGAPVALARLPGGNIVMGDSQGVNVWDGTAWTSLGGNINGAVMALTTLSNGDLVAGGFFSMAGGVPAASVARWDGVSWHDIGGGVWGPGALAATVFAVHEDGNGDLLVGGWLASAGGNATGPIARWDGLMWSAFGGGFVAPASNAAVEVRAIETTLYGPVIGGSFPVASGLGVGNVAWMPGSTWQPLQQGMRQQVAAMAALDDGSVLVAGAFTDVEGVPSNGIARWDGQAWTPLGSGLAAASGEMPVVQSISIADNGDTYVGGLFVTAGGAPAVGLAKWDGSMWSALGTGLSNPPLFEDVPVYDTLMLANGDLLVTGFFAYAGGVTVNGMARWDGSSWAAFGDGTGAASHLAQLANGDVVKGGFFQVGALVDGVLRWDGSNWVSLGGGLAASTNLPLVNAMLTLSTGELVVAGQFDAAGGMPVSNIASWNGTTWQSMGAGLPGNVAALVELPNGDLIAGGGEPWRSGSATGLRRWDGSTWTQLGDGEVAAAALSSSGELFAAGAWSVLGATTKLSFASLTTPCQADAVASGSGCVGSGGANVLAATTLPWLGGTFASEATGMPANGLVVSVRGLSTIALPLGTILSQGQPGCDLLVSPDLLDLHLPVAGTATTSFSIPNTSALVGQVLHQQVVPVEVNAAGGIVALTASNRVTLTIGAF